MGKTALSIHKEIIKKEYAASPLGQAEKKLRKIYDALVLAQKQLPEDEAKKVYDIREANEKWNLDYIERTQKEQRQAVDDKLLEAMTNELSILQASDVVKGLKIEL